MYLEGASKGIGRGSNIGSIGRAALYRRIVVGH